MMPYADVERRRANVRRYHSDPSNRERVNAIKRAWRQRNLHKVAAHSAVARALRKGTLVKEPCEVCGDVNVHAHHDDYDKKLEVRWLCPLHHGAERVAS